MSSASHSVNTPTSLERAERLKRELAEFATAGKLKDEFEQQRKLFFELSGPADASEAENVMDWFLFDWFDDQGVGAIAHFIASNADLDEDDKRILTDWEDSINSVFEIRSLGKNSVSLREMDNEDSFAVTTITPLEQTPFKRGQFIAARLLPLGDGFIFSGLQFIMPDRQSAMEALEMRRSLETLNSPESIEKAQREQCSAFCEFFGCDELTIPPTELTNALGQFQHYLLTERRDPETGLTPAERFKSEFGRDLNMPDMPPIPPELTNFGDLTILCDEFDGLVLLPDFNKFRQVFETTKPDKAMAGWQELVWNYIKDPDIPIVAFERVAEKYPDRLERVLRQLLDDKDFSIEHLYAVLLHYKQPVEGIDNLKDDERLWDLLNGNTAREPAKRKQAAKAKPGRAINGNKPGKAAAARSKKLASAKAKPAAKKAAAKKATARKAPVKRASAKKAPARKATAKAAPRAGTRKAGSRKKR